MAMQDRATPAPAPAPGTPRMAGLRRSLREHWADPLYRNSYYLMANTLTVTGAGFVFNALATRLAGAEQYGQATAILSALTLLSLLARLGFDVSLLRDLPRTDADRARRLVNTTFTVSSLAALTGALLFPLVVPHTPLWSESLRPLESPWFALAFAGLVWLWTLGTLIDTVLTARRRGDYVFQKNLLHSALKVAGLVALLPLLAASSRGTGIVVAWVGSMLVAAGAAFAWWLPRTKTASPRPGFHMGTLRGILSSSLANYAVSVINILPASLGTLIVAHRFGAVENGHFYVLWAFGSVSISAPSMIGQSSLVEMAHRGTTKVVHAGRAVAGSAAVGIGLLLVGVVLLPLFGTADAFYAQGGAPGRTLLLLPFALACVPATWFSIRMAAMRAREKHVPLVVTVAVLAGLFLGALWLVPTDVGVAASGWFWLGAVLVSTGVSWGLTWGLV